MIVDTTSRIDYFGGVAGFRGFAGIPELKSWLAQLPFKNGDAINDFVGGVGLRGSAGKWRGIPSALADQVSAAIGRAQGSPSAEALLRRFTSDVSPLAEKIGQEQRFGLFGRPEEQDRRYWESMSAFVARMQRYTAEEASLPSAGAGFIPGGSTGVSRGIGGGLLGNKTLMYVGAGVGTLILLALVVRRRKKPE